MTAFAQNDQCLLCPRQCVIPQGGRGYCLARANRDGDIIEEGYGRITALALDPMEKKPLRNFHPGSLILSAGFYGCNMRCPFCQNAHISMSMADYQQITPEALAEKAAELKTQGNIGLAYTYNEPSIHFGFLMDCAEHIHAQGQYNVLVTNGFLNPTPWEKLMQCMDAVNIDLKGFSEEYYRKLGGDLGTVMRNIKTAAQYAHMEITTLIVPGENDEAAAMEKLCAFIAGIREDIPLHISRFFPQYQMLDKPATPMGTMRELTDIAKGYLRHVYMGNC